MNAKHFLTSRTLWFNALYLVVAVAKQYGFANFVPHALVDPLVALVIVPVINIILRTRTTQPVAINPPPSTPAAPVQ